MPQPDGGRLDELRRRARLAYVAGAEGWMREHAGRAMTGEELGRVIDGAPD